MKNFIKNVDWMKAVGVAGTVLGLAGTLLSNMSQKNAMQESIKKEVEKALSSNK